MIWRRSGDFEGRHDQPDVVALRRAHHRQSDARVAARRFDEGIVGVESVGFLRGLDHESRRAVLRGPPGLNDSTFAATVAPAGERTSTRGEPMVSRMLEFTALGYALTHYTLSATGSVCRER